MIFIKEMGLTPKQAKHLISLGFHLVFIEMLCREWDRYQVFVKGC